MDHLAVAELRPLISFSQSLLRITLLASPLNHPLACTTMSLDVGSLRLASLVHLGSEKG